VLTSTEAVAARLRSARMPSEATIQELDASPKSTK
jgi:hypothetical protein